jgi:hypothetical protein
MAAYGTVATECGVTTYYIDDHPQQAAVKDAAAIPNLWDTTAVTVPTYPGYWRFATALSFGDPNKNDPRWWTAK